MMTLVMGGSGSGKSAWAEAYTVSLSSGKKYYLATMQVTDAESAGKAERHRRLRAGKGFVTIEQPRDIAQAAGRMTGEKREERTALLECMSNLTANEMFSGAVPAGAEQTAEKILREIDCLQRQLTHLIIVTNNVFEDGREYDETTMEYIRALGLVNEGLAARADTVAEVVVGIPLFLKGGESACICLRD